MKRDFSNSTREQIISIINDRDALYSNDISSIDLFVCKDATDVDFQMYSADISESVRTANSSVSGSNVDADDLVIVINQVVDDAHTLDANYTTKIETDTANTVIGYADDLDIFVNALAVGHMGDSKTEMLENLGKYDSDSVFGEPGEFASDLDNSLQQRLYNDLVINGEVNYGLVENIMNDDSLTEREKLALIKLVNSVYVDENGELDYEGLERFLECCYVPAGTGGVAMHDTFALTGAYYDFSSAYNTYINTMIQCYNGPLEIDEKPVDLPSPLDVIFYSHTSVNGIFQGMGACYGEIYLPEAGWDETGTEKYYYNLDLDITETDDGWISIIYGDNLQGFDCPQEPLLISPYSELSYFGYQYDIASNEQYIESIQDSTDTAIYEALFDLAFGEASGYYQSNVVEEIPVVGEYIAAVTNVVSAVVTAEADAQNEIDAQTEQLQQENAESYYQTIVQSLDCHGTVIVCGNETIVVNPYFCEDDAQAVLDNYNESVQGQNGPHLDTTDMWNAVNNPAGTDFNQFEQYLDFLVKPEYSDN